MNSDDASRNGTWKLPPDDHPQRLAALPADGLPNGLAIDPAGGARRNARLVLAAQAAARLGMIPAALLSVESAEAVPESATPGGRLVLPPTPACPLPALPALLGGAAALQRLTLALVERAGVNPDLIRREEAPYREAAEIAEGSADW